MNRAFIHKDGKLSSEWFFIDQAICFKESENYKYTELGKKLHELAYTQELYLSRNKSWIIKFHTDWSSSADRYYYTSDENAAAWLIENEYGPDEITHLPEDVFNTILDEMEISEA